MPHQLWPLHILLVSVLFLPQSEAIIEHALPTCARPGLDLGTKAGAALGGFGSAAYTGLMSSCPAMVPHLTTASVTMPGLMIGGPLAPLAAMLAAGVVGGAVLGGATGSIISCREIGVQNDSHYLVQFQNMRHPDGWTVQVDKEGTRYKPQSGYNHHVHPRPHPDFDKAEEEEEDEAKIVLTPEALQSLLKPSKQMHNVRDLPYEFEEYRAHRESPPGLGTFVHNYRGFRYRSQQQQQQQQQQQPNHYSQTLKSTFPDDYAQLLGAVNGIQGGYQAPPLPPTDAPAPQTSALMVNLAQNADGGGSNPKYEMGFVPIEDPNAQAMYYPAMTPTAMLAQSLLPTGPQNIGPDSAKAILTHSTSPDVSSAGPDDLMFMLTPEGVLAVEEVVGNVDDIIDNQRLIQQIQNQLEAQALQGAGTRMPRTEDRYHPPVVSSLPTPLPTPLPLASMSTVGPPPKTIIMKKPDRDRKRPDNGTISPTAENIQDLLPDYAPSPHFLMGLPPLAELHEMVEHEEDPDIAEESLTKRMGRYAIHPGLINDLKRIRTFIAGTSRGLDLYGRSLNNYPLDVYTRPYATVGRRNRRLNLPSYPAPQYPPYPAPHHRVYHHHLRRRPANRFKPSPRLKPSVVRQLEAATKLNAYRHLKKQSEKKRQRQRVLVPSSPLYTLTRPQYLGSSSPTRYSSRSRDVMRARAGSKPKQEGFIPRLLKSFGQKLGLIKKREIASGSSSRSQSNLNRGQQAVVDPLMRLRIEQARAKTFRPSPRDPAAILHKKK